MNINLVASTLTRRGFISTLGKASAAVALGASHARGGSVAPTVLTYLKDYAELYQSDPRGASLRWFRDAKAQGHIHKNSMR